MQLNNFKPVTFCNGFIYLVNCGRNTECQIVPPECHINKKIADNNASD
jgi:hypothetical protein